jgi:hypothetical protein
VKLEWKREDDGSYTSVAGRVWRYPGESWGTCCITPVPELTGLKHLGRVGNLKKSKQELERYWTLHVVSLKVEELRAKLGPAVSLEVANWEPLKLRLSVEDVTPEQALSIGEILRPKVPA